MTYAEAVQFLYGLRLFGAKFGLENTFKLAALAGRPQDRLRFIHVAGTNGKGSTCAMLESIYRASGLRTGLFTSPHLVSFRERIQVNRQLIPEPEVVRLVEALQPLLKQFPTGHHPTFFEVVTVMALKFFTEQKCDLVVWETGLGGWLDATNIVMPLASIITNIALDHQQWLGDTVEKIAAEKAGIIKPEVPVITAADPDGLAVIERTAREKNAPLEVITAKRLASTLAPPLLGEHQRLNAALAVATVEVLQNKIPVSEASVRTGLESVNWPGRLQLVTRASGQKILLDGAHNVAGAKALRETLESWSPSFSLSGSTLKCELQRAGPDQPSLGSFGAAGADTPRKFTLILGILGDKDWRHICETLAPLAGQILTLPVSSERTAAPRELAAACCAANPAAEVIACDSLAGALEKTAGANFVVITGSLYLVGEALEILGLSPVKGGERALNEWTVPAALANNLI